MISLVDMRPAWGWPAGAQQRCLPLRHKRLAEIINLAKNLDDPIHHHRLRNSASAGSLQKPFSHKPLLAGKLLIRLIETIPASRVMHAETIRATPSSATPPAMPEASPS